MSQLNEPNGTSPPPVDDDSDLNRSHLWKRFILPLVALTLGTTALMIGLLFAIPAPEPQAPDPTLAIASPSARARPADVLFQELCSLCHGADGGGNGPTKLERPARSFIEGGYGYGNTLAALMRTLEHGIPGTAMPAFGTTLSLQERTSLAQYVLSLGPPIRRVSISDGNLARSERPVLLQGAMEDPTTGSLEPRSLLVGFSDGATVQYRTGDMTLVAARQVEDDEPIAKRADWRGQGGSPHIPEGSIVYRLDRDETPAPDYVSNAGTPLVRRHLGTRLEGTTVTLRFELRDGASRVAEGTETVNSMGGKHGAILARTLTITGGATSVRLAPLAGEEVQRSEQYTVNRVREGLLGLDPEAESRSGALTRHYFLAGKWHRGLENVLQ